MNWLFEGFGTAIIMLLIGAAGGGAAGYRIGIKKVTKQSQRAGDNSNQIQVGDGTYHGK